MKAKFIEIVSCDGNGGFLQHEIVNVNTIQNVYIVQPGETDMVIRCVYAKKFNGDDFHRWVCRDFTEHFADRTDCLTRYNELQKILVGNYSSYGANNLVREANGDYAKVKKELDKEECLDKQYINDSNDDDWEKHNFAERNHITVKEVEDIMKRIREGETDGLGK